jgi:hypothetical protein
MILKIIAATLFSMLVLAGLLAILGNPYQFMLLGMSILRLIGAVFMYVFLVLL